MDRWQQFFVDTLNSLKKCSTCKRMQVSSLIVRDNRIISTGVNGTPKGMTHCCDHFHGVDTTTEEFKAAHREWSVQKEIHGEQNSLSMCCKNGISTNGCDIYISHSPCLSCAKLIIASGIQRVFYLEKYDRKEDTGLSLLEEAGLYVEQLEEK